MHIPKISVVMPVYNGEKYLSEAIESILKQTFADFEFIIVYDKSQDSSLEIIKRYMEQDERIKLIELDSKGLVYSLNAGIDIAKGKYIARMDADDISLPKRFEKQYHYMEKNPDVDILGTYIEVFGSDVGTNLSVENWFNENVNDSNQYSKTILGCPIAHPTVMMKSKFSKIERYSSYYNMMEDYELWMRATINGYKIANINQVLLNYRLHTESKSNKEKVGTRIKQIIDYKLEKFLDKKKKNVLVWGLGLRGKIFVDYIPLSRWSDTINILAIIDKGKKGVFNNFKIISPYEIDNYNYDYIFITTVLGHKNISIYLNQKGLKMIKDYMYPV